MVNRSRLLLQDRPFLLQGRLLQGPLVHAAALMEAAALLQGIVMSPRTTFFVMLAL